MDSRTYNRMTREQVVGRKVRLTRRIRSGLFEFAPGTICTIENKQAGYSLTTDQCPTCGIKARISRVRPGDLELLPEEETAQPEPIQEPRHQ